MLNHVDCLPGEDVAAVDSRLMVNCGPIELMGLVVTVPVHVIGPDNFFGVVIVTGVVKTVKSVEPALSGTETLGGAIAVHASYRCGRALTSNVLAGWGKIHTPFADEVCGVAASFQFVFVFGPQREHGTERKKKKKKKEQNEMRR